MNLKELIKEARKYLQPPEEDEQGPDLWNPSEGQKPKTAPHAAVAAPRAAVAAPCPKDTVKQRKPDGTTACVSLRGIRKS
jgi:hypothetical protein